ncbi:cytochrome c biogenesis protein [Campylobacter iguaniorum]|uniref:Cytochrome c biogenesis protein n=1 Tax=Campylobacter iguaniorum TaxID=1244531 RepID=A0A076FEU1_9BACT|nr:cytochrome c biogenesis protein CcsA [Campylobacter iguaniorum]AII14329.1 cytochrome c biogenesis protein [Campylobacter iguaniorum]ALV24064.1 cytochrome c biogenesis protein [Campylobacter iguaniorum]
MNVLKKVFLSMGSALVLFLIFAVASGVATIIESKYNTQTAWAIVYGAPWFALIQLLLGINLAYNIFKYRIFTLKKLPAFIFHVSFLFILLGSALTRYIGFEGNMHIRENEQSNEISTMQSYIQLKAIDDDKTYMVSEPMYISSTGTNSFKLSVDVAGKPATLTYKSFVPNAVQSWEENKNGEAVLEVMFSDEANSRSVAFGEGENAEVGDISFTFNAEPKQEKYIKVTLEDGKFFIQTNQNVSYMQMNDMSKGVLEKDKKVPFEGLRLYSLDGVNFAPKTMLASAIMSAKQADSNTQGVDAIIANLNYDGVDMQVPLFSYTSPIGINIKDKHFALSWTPMMIKLPFALHLKDFELKRYPGSNSPMSYSSSVIVKDGDMNMDYDIYMNHVLDHKGYRFFQSSYDMDEKGTVLSVNSDPGKLPTYIGYFLLGLGLLLNVINPNSRFRKLARNVNEANAKNLAAIFMVFSVLFFATDSSAYNSLPGISAEHAKNLSTIIVQSADGRMKPFDTTSHEILNKIYRSDNYNGMDANQVILSMMTDSAYWRNVPLVKITDKELKKLLGIPVNQKYASFNDFFANSNTQNMEYKLIKHSELANRKSPAARNQFDKDVIKADEKLNIVYMVFMGELFRVIPKQDDANNSWFSPAGATMSFASEEAKEVTGMLKNYFEGVYSGQSTGNWKKADDALQVLKDYQAKYGAAVMPSQSKIDIELAFNKYKIFQNLTPVYLLAGFALLIVVFIRMIRPKLRFNLVFKVVYVVNILAFVIHTIGLGLRWYIAEHAPWSDSYESMVFIAWSLALSGMVFARSSAISLALTSILAGVTLFVAHLSWLDPQITTLVPVLQSYWLTIHVSVITASYGFLGLCSLLGFFTLILFALQGKKENPELSRNILEATRINEMAMILGLSLLVFGNFLGGVWANESWGRYWGWDSKETWALVSILVYAAIVHMRFVAKVNSQYAFAVASMFGYSSIIMTYFGVNFYLAGMHSYAAGDPVPVPDFVWITILVMVIVSLLAYRKKGFSKHL